MDTLITNVKIVNEGRVYDGYLAIEGNTIAEIGEGDAPDFQPHRTIDAGGALLLPGVIDTHVHFREPGLQQKADIRSESRAAACGGVTTYFDMPNTVPQTTTIEALEDKYARAQKDSAVNYAFLFGATNDNYKLFPHLDVHRVPAIKLFMGSSTGNMLVDRREALDNIFRTAPLPLMAHCEDSTIIARNMQLAQMMYGDDPDVCHHPEIRSAKACYESTALAVSLANAHHQRLHVAHVTTARELQLFSSVTSESLPLVTAEAVVAHLLFTDADYATLGTRIKCNPAVKTMADREELRRAITDGRIYTVATDHAPHLIADKQGGAQRAASGMPMIQFSLVSMLQLVDEGVLTVTQVADLMCHHPAHLFQISKRGYLRQGYKADLVLVERGKPWTVTTEDVKSKCGWSPVEGRTYNWRVIHTFCNGQHVYNHGLADDISCGQPVDFRY